MYTLKITMAADHCVKNTLQKGNREAGGYQRNSGVSEDCALIQEACSRGRETWKYNLRETF
jgi:hypothetical protein